MSMAQLDAVRRTMSALRVQLLETTQKHQEKLNGKDMSSYFISASEQKKHKNKQKQKQQQQQQNEHQQLEEFVKERFCHFISAFGTGDWMKVNDGDDDEDEKKKREDDK